MKIALLLTSESVAQLLVPLILLVCMLGFLGWWDQHVAPQLLDILPIEEWPAMARFTYRLIHGY